MTAQHYDELLGYFTRSMKDRDAAADIVQEAYARLFALQRQGQSIADARALLYRMAHNLVVDQHRRAQVRQHDQVEELTEPEQPQAPQHLQPEEVAASRQTIRLYLATIEALPPRCREVFVLHVFNEFTHAQIAQHLGISVSMVEKHMVRAMLACRARERELHARG